MDSDFKVVVAIFFVGIVASLGKALYHMSSGPSETSQMANALSLRIGFSIALFILIAIAWHLGLIAPHTVR